MRRILLSWRLPIAAALFALAAAAPAPAQISTSYVLGANYGTKPRIDPLYAENAFDIYYPLGGCPLGPGCANTTYPVVIFIRGGNSNNPTTGPTSLGALNVSLLEAGFVVVLPSYHVIDVDAGEDYTLAADDLGRCVQYLRRFHTILNIDPERVFAIGHSGGGFYSYYLGLNKDYQNTNARDLVELESSRPNFIISWGAATNWSCMDLANPATNPIILQMFLVTQIDDALLAASPSYWLENPSAFGRTDTPPMCLVYNLQLQTNCGFITDFHDGYFGPLMLGMIKRFCSGSGEGQSVCDGASVLIDSFGDTNVVIQNVVAWMVDKAAP